MPAIERTIRCRAILELLEAQPGWGEAYLPLFLKARGIPVARVDLFVLLDDLARAGFVEIKVTELGIRVPFVTAAGVEVLEGCVQVDWISARPMGQ